MSLFGAILEKLGFGHSSAQAAPGFLRKDTTRSKKTMAFRTLLTVGSSL